VLIIRPEISAITPSFLESFILYLSDTSLLGLTLREVRKVSKWTD